MRFVMTLMICLAIGFFGPVSTAVVHAHADGNHEGDAHHSHAGPGHSHQAQPHHDDDDDHHKQDSRVRVLKLMSFSEPTNTGDTGTEQAGREPSEDHNFHVHIQMDSASMGSFTPLEAVLARSIPQTFVDVGGGPDGCRLSLLRPPKQLL